MYTNKTKQYILPIVLLAGFATGCECSNKKEPASRTPGSNVALADNTQTLHPPKYTLQLLGLESNYILGDTNKCRIVITKTENGTVTTIDAAELPNLTLTPTSDINDGTQATLQGIDPLKLDNYHIRPGTIEKEVIIKRGTAETRLTITLTNGTGAVQGTATVVVAPALVFDVSITLKGGQKPVRTGSSQRIFEVEITSKQEDIDVNKLSDITLEFIKDDPSNYILFHSSNPKEQGNMSFPVQPGVTTLRELLEANSVNKLQKGVPSTLRFTLSGRNPSATLTNIKLAGTLDPDDAANYIPKVTYNKPNVILSVTPLAQGEKDFILTITTATELTKKDLENLYILYTANPSDGKLVYNKKDLNDIDLSEPWVTDPLLPGVYSIKCKVWLTKKAETEFELNLLNTADGTKHTLTYTP